VIDRPLTPEGGHRTVAALHPPFRRCFQQFLKFLFVELRVGRGEMAAPGSSTRHECDMVRK
jgi:hypothetical protein